MVERNVGQSIQFNIEILYLSTSHPQTEGISLLNHFENDKFEMNLRFPFVLHVSIPKPLTKNLLNRKKIYTRKQKKSTKYEKLDSKK